MLKKLGQIFSKVMEGIASVYFTLCFMIVIAIFPIKAIVMLVNWLWNMF